MPFDAGDDAVLVDPDQDTWALVLPDATSIEGYRRLFPSTTDEMTRASMWSGVRSALPQRAGRPETVLDVAATAVPSETNDDAVGYTFPWLVAKVVTLAARPGRRPRGPPRRGHASCSATPPPAPRSGWPPSSR